MARRMMVIAAVVCIVGSDVPDASAQVFGTFTWQMQPFCNKVTLTLTAVPGNFTIDGADDQCGATRKASASGMAVFNPDGTVGLNFTIVTPTAHVAQVAASVSPANGQGTWTDSLGNGGTFAFFGNLGGLPPRPAMNASFRVVGHQTIAVPNGTLLTVDGWTSAPAENLGGGVYTPASGTYRVPTAGLYLITAAVRWNAFSAGGAHRCSYIAVNGARMAALCGQPSTTASFQMEPLTATLRLTAGSLVSILVYQASGAAASLGGSAEVAWSVARLH